MELRFTTEKLWYYGKTMVLWKKTMLPYRKLWHFDLRRKKTWQITKNYETLIYTGKKLWLYTKTIEVFEHIYSLRTLIYYGKNMVSMEKIIHKCQKCRKSCDLLQVAIHERDEEPNMADNSFLVSAGTVTYVPFRRIDVSILIYLKVLDV